MKKPYRVLCGLLLCLALVGTLLTALCLPAKAYPAELKEAVDVRQYYTLGERLIIPEGVLVVGGQEYAATASVVLPSGVALRTTMLDLDTVGQYTLQYTAEVDGKQYLNSQIFTVRQDAISLSGTGSYELDEDTGWLTCSLDNMESICYNLPVDLSELTKNDELISVIVNASETGKRDFEEYIIVLTDAYDSQNCVYVRVKAAINFTTNPASPEYYTTYQAYVAADFADHNQFVGLEGSSKLHRGDSYGRPVHNSFCNMTKTSSITHEMDALSLRWDNDEKAFYVTSPGFYVNPVLVADMNSTEHFSNNWQGFTKDVVYVSLYVKEVSGSANLTVKHIAGSKLVSGAIEDTTLPEITVNYGDYSALSVPKAVVGQPYKLFDAVAEDLNMYASQVSTKVYLNYQSSTQRMVTVTDGCFTPEYTGTYAIVYSAADSFGNEQQEVVYVDAIRSDAIDFEVGGGSAKGGHLATLAVPEIPAGSANTGNYTLTVTAKNGETSDLVYQGLLDEFTGTYRFMALGQWTVEYTVSDYSRSTTSSVTWEVTAGQSVIIDAFEDLSIDAYLVAGNTCRLPQVQVVSFESGEAVYTPATLKVVYGTKETKLADYLFTPDLSDGTEVQIVYCDENNAEAVISGTRQIYEVVDANNKVDMTKLFLTDNATVTADKGSINFTTDLDTKIELLNKQGAENLTVNFNLKGNKNFGKFHVILTDSEDPDISVRVTFENRFNTVSDTVNGNTNMYLNGESQRFWKLMGSFGELNATEFNMVYSNTARAVKIDGMTAAIDTCINGQSFEGFPSKAVYITFEMSDITGNAIAELKSVNGQILSSAQMDLSIPRVHILDYYQSSYAYGESFTTLEAFGIDVISGYSTATVTVRMEDGTVLHDVNGVELQNVDATQGYTVALEQYGKYVIQYSTKDRFGNRSDIIASAYSFTVADTQKPEMSFSGELQKFARVNDQLTLPKIEVTDNSSQTMPVNVVIVKPNGTYITAQPESFIFEEQGTYTVILTAFDSAGNAARTSYYVEVVADES